MHSGWVHRLCSQVLFVGGVASFGLLPAWGDTQSVFRFEHLSTEKGLSHNTVIEILQDSYGFLWLGTLNGLDRYDGYSFTAYKPVAGDESSLSHNVINALFEDHRGILWIGTLNGLNRYDRARDKFVRIIHDPRNTNTLVDNRIRCITEDHTGLIWIGTEGGLCSYNPETNAFRTYLPEPDKPTTISDFIIHDIFEDSHRQLWVATEKGGVNRFNRTTQTFTSFPIEVSDPSKGGTSAVMTIGEDQWGNIWIGTWGEGLQRLDPNQQRFHRLNLTSGSSSTTPAIITRILIDSAQRMWICTYGQGLFIIPQIPRNPTVRIDNYQHYIYNPYDATGIRSNTLWTVYMDRTGVAWLGNENGGINKCDTKQSHIQHFRAGLASHSSLSNNHVTSFFEDKEGKIWIGTRFGGLNRFDPAKSSFSVIRHQSGQENGLGSDAILCLAGDKDYLWIGTDGYGLDRYNFRSGQFKHYRHDDRNPHSIGENAVYALYLDDKKTLWVGTWGGGLSRLNPDGETFTNFPVDRINERLNVVTAIIQDTTGALWLGTYGKGLVYFDPRTTEMLYFNYSAQDSFSLGHDNISTLLVSHNGTLWIGTMGGGLNYLSYYDREAGQALFQRYDLRQGLPDNIIECLIEDEEGRLWMGTNHGVARLDPLSGEIRSFDRHDGFGQDIFYHQAAMRARNGTLYFGGTEGFNVLRSPHITYNPFVPPVLITQLQIFNEVITPGLAASKQRLKQSIFMTDKLTLSYKDNVFSFEFAALDFSCPQKNQYAYKMEGFDQDWRLTSADRRYASYTNLPPGDYTFRVIASNNHGLWNEQGAALHITITPPFWQTSWMMAIYIALIIGAVFLIRTAVQIRERNKAQTELKLMEAAKNHEIDQLKLRFFTHISHEFRTPLTLIIGPVERMLRLGDQIDSKKREIYNRLVLQNARRLLRLVNQLMDARKLDTGSMPLDLQEKDFVAFAKAIFSVFHLQAEQRRIQYSFTSDCECRRFWFDPDKIEKALYNVISNAFKFTPPGGTVAIALTCCSQNPGTDTPQLEGAEGMVRVEVRDTGIGIDADQIDRIFDPFYQVRRNTSHRTPGTGIGLSISKDFIAMHGGRILVDSTPGKGSLFTLLIPIRTQIAESQKSPTPKDETGYEEEQAELPADDSLINNIEEGTIKPSRGAAKRKPLVLIVEDDKDLSQYLCLELESRYSIIQAPDGLSGFELAVDHIPDLIICDILMPVMDGCEFCRRCKSDQRTSHIPIIILTAHTADEKRKEGLMAGADDYIIKPFNADLLHIRLENLLRTRQRIQERLGQLVYFRPADIKISSPDEHFIQKVIEIIDQNISDSGFSVDDLAYHIGLSRAQLYRKLKGVIDHTPSDFIRLYRLQRAWQLLEKGHVPSQVCYQVGFRDPSYFSKCFRKQFGRTPQQVYLLHETHIDLN